MVATTLPKEKRTFAIATSIVTNANRHFLYITDSDQLSRLKVSLSLNDFDSTLKRIQHHLTMASGVPDDLLFQILLLLPVASLLRFKLACKSWLSLIESSSFVSQHTRRSHSETNLENALTILKLIEHPIPNYKFMFVADLQLSNHKDFKLNADEKVGGRSLIASFDGIICLQHDIVSYEGEWGAHRSPEDGHLVFKIPSIRRISVVSLWNPATKYAKILPPPLGGMRSSFDKWDFPAVCGFGFDVKTNDYRVVRFIMQDFKQDSKVLKSHVEVYSLNMDSWRVIDVASPVKIWITSSPSRPFRNGSYCWSGWDFISEDPVLLMFDFSNEVFRVIPMKKVFGNIQVSIDYTSHSTLAFLREELTCIHWAKGASIFEDCCCRVWLFNDTGIKEYWTQLYEIMFQPEVCPLGFSADGKMILEEKKYGCDNEVHLFLLDLAMREVIDTPYRGKFVDVAVYKESLVSVKGAIGETYMVDSKSKAFCSTWDNILSQVIMASNERFARIFDQDAGSSLIIFDEPNPDSSPATINLEEGARKRKSKEKSLNSPEEAAEPEEHTAKRITRSALGKEPADQEKAPQNCKGGNRGKQKN